MLDDLIASAGIVVDRRGSRFTDEGTGGVAVTNVLARSDDPRGAWIVIGEVGFDEAGARGPYGLSLPAPVEVTARGGRMVRAETLAELARLAEMSGTVLESTIAAHNDAVAAGTCTDLAVSRTGSPRSLEGPYLAVPVVPGITYTMGGPLVDGSMRVLDHDERPLEGLFAAGSTFGGLQGGPRGGYIGGLAPALVTGLIAGDAVESAVDRGPN